MNQVIALVVAYLLGSIPFALIAGKLHGVDLRTMGSGNLGATNVFRTLGRTAGITVMVLDIAKGAAAVLVAEALTDNPWPLVAGALAILGHVFPVWTGFKGGKGVAVGAGALIGLVPAASGVLIVLWCVLGLTTRYVAIASAAALGCAKSADKAVSSVACKARAATEVGTSRPRNSSERASSSASANKYGAPDARFASPAPAAATRSRSSDGTSDGRVDGCRRVAHTCRISSVALSSEASMGPIACRSDASTPRTPRSAISECRCTR